MYSTQSEEIRENKLNNKGFSLLEVLVAVIILSIVSIPIIRSFATVAKTNADAKILLRATDGAENMMENLEYRTLDEMMDRYDGSSNNTVTVNGDEVCSITIKDVADLPVKLPDGYYMKIVADPTKYPNANAINIADVKSMSIADTAVYEMPAIYDAGIYEKFDRWNMEANDDQPTLYDRKNKQYFKENLTRTIEITIDKMGEYEAESGENVDLVSVKLNIRYYFRSKSQYEDYLPKAHKEYVETTRELYNNVTTKIPLSSIFVLYQPRYLATQNGNTDNIIINNEKNVKANVLISAQRGADDVSYKSQYFNATSGPNVTIVEDISGNIADADAAITLMTNLSNNVPYSSLPSGGTVENGKILCNLTYQNIAGTSKVKGEDAVICLDGRDLDGKALIANKTKNRIYKVTVSVLDPADNVIVELDGTKLE